MKKSKKNPNKAFTLIELLVVIALIAIVFLSMNSLDFSTLSDKQKAEIFTNKVVSEIETARNNALMGKVVIDKNGEEIVPKWWVIGFYSKHYKDKENTVEVRFFKKNQEFKIVNRAYEGEKETNEYISFDKLEKYSSFKDKKGNKIIINCENTESNKFWDIHLTMNGKDFFKDPSCKGQNIIINTSYKNHTYQITIDSVTGIVSSEYIK